MTVQAAHFASPEPRITVRTGPRFTVQLALVLGATSSSPAFAVNRNPDGTVFHTKSEALTQSARDLIALAGAVYGVGPTSIKAT